MNFAAQISLWLNQHKSSTLPAWLKRNPMVLQWVAEQSQGYYTKNIMEQVYIALNGPPALCQQGNQRQFNTFDKGYRAGCILGNQCACVARLRLNNQKKTLIQKYGVETTGQTPGNLDKRKATMLNRYGVEFAMHSPEIKELKKKQDHSRTPTEWSRISETRSQSYLQKYGVSHHMKLESQQQKVKTTNLARYQSEFPMQNSEIAKKTSDAWRKKSQVQRQEILSKTKNTMLEIYGVDSGSRIGMPQETLALLADPEAFKGAITGLTRLQAREKLNVAEHTLYLYAKKYDASDLFAYPSVSAFELGVRQYIESLGITPVYNCRSVLNPQELDIYIPEKNIAIECGGLYWHSENSAGRTRTYHGDKYDKCRSQGVTLITMFDDEWNMRTDLVKDRLAHILGCSSVKLYARQCQVVEITPAQANEFVNEHHLQGNVSAKINLALCHAGQIVAVMTLGTPRYNRKFQYEMLRFCTQGSVIGAASKLFAHFKKIYNPVSVISYSDNRWGSGRVYESLGFSRKHSTVGYSYTDYKTRYDRVKFQKHRLVAAGADPDLTEWQIMQSRGYDRVWDCGQTMWTYVS